MYLKTMARLLIGLLIIAALLYKFDLHEVVSTMRLANPRYLALAILTYSLTFLILAIRWKMILGHMKENLPLSSAYQAFVGGILISDFTPARIGDLTRPLMVRDKITLKKGTASLFIDRYSDLLTVSLLGFSGVLLLSGLFNLYLILIISLLLAALLSISLLWFKRSFLIQFVERRGPAKLLQYAKKFDEATAQLDDASGLMVRTIMLTVIAWFTHALRIIFIAKSVGYDVSFLVLLLLQPLISALALVPITISGLGLVEGGLTALLASMDVPITVGISIALLDRILTVAFHVLVGGRYATKIL